MSRINITKEHYDYANSIVKIFGFNNLADYATIISYDKIKENTTEIANSLSKTMIKFKKLFSLKEFDLARIDYKFETVEQCYGFFKKILEYLFIPYYTFREKSKQYVRLIQQNNLYKQYIMNVTEIGQTDNMLVSKKKLKVDDYSELSDEHKLFKKIDLLKKLGELASSGIKISQNYDTNSDYYVMKYEYSLHKLLQANEDEENEESDFLKKLKESDNYNELSSDSQMLKKLDMLKKMAELVTVGVKLSQHYDINSDYFTMKCEYALHTSIREKYCKQQTVLGIGDDAFELIKELMDEPKKINNYKISELKRNYSKKPFDTEFLITRSLLLTNVRDLYDCITNIAIEVYDKDKYKLEDKFNVKLKLGLFKEFFDKNLVSEKRTIKIDIPIFINNMEDVILTCKMTNSNIENIIFRVVISGFKLKSIVPKNILNLNLVMLDTYTNNNSVSYSITNGHITGEIIHVPIQPKYSAELINDNYEKSFEINCEYYKKIKFYNDQSKIVEYNMNVLDNDVWITSINNDNDNGYNDENETNKGYYSELCYFALLEKYEKYGYSFLNKETIKRKNFGLEMNMYRRYDFNTCVVENENLIINFTLPRDQDMITKIKILNKFDKLYNFTVQIYKQNQVYYEQQMNTHNLIDIKLPEPMFSYSCLEPKITIRIHKSKLNDWNSVFLCVSGIYVDSDMRKLASEKIREI